MKPSNTMNLSYFIVICLLLGSSYQQAPPAEETVSVNHCTLGKCGKCRRRGSGGTLRMICTMCFESSINKDGQCSGDSTPFANCGASIGIRTPFTPTAPEFGCGYCHIGFHADMDKGTCYRVPTITNCASETKISFLGVETVTCTSCNNGFKLKDSTSFRRQLFFGTTKTNQCDPGTQVENCVGMGPDSKCVICKLDYYATAAGSCAMRETDEQKMCQTGVKYTPSGYEGTEIYCEACNIGGGWTETYSYKEGSTYYSKCEFQALTEAQLVARGFAMMGTSIFMLESFLILMLIKLFYY